MTLTAVDLFCGAGGFSTGLYQACERSGKRVRLVGVNHWPIAIETHATNHPDAELYCESLDNIDPRKIVRGRLDILIASPECTHHSIARGGKPINDQSRATAWHVLRWAEALLPRVILIENVREFQTWGPIGCNGRPLCRRRGETFQAFIRALRSLGYTVESRVLNAANYGDATTRERLFIVAGRGRRIPRYPDPTHARLPGMFGEQPWRAAREIIDWSIASPSIFGRKRPLVPATLRRIEEGIRRYWGEWAEPFLVVLRGTGTARRTDQPLPTVTAGGGHFGIVEPFLVQQAHGGRVHAAGKPMPTITAQDREYWLAQPFILGQQSGSTPRMTGDPIPTVASSGAISLVEPFIVPTNYGERSGQRPRTHSCGTPLPTVVGSNTHGLVEPFIVNYNGNGTAHPVSDPLDTVTTRDRFGLVEPFALDIGFRMLQPHELAAAMSFPSDYRFSGTKSDIVRQIGNAVPVGTARELIAALVN
jgi:DNA (cytosine-5)-methyltransferase 1